MSILIFFLITNSPPKQRRSNLQRNPKAIRPHPGRNTWNTFVARQWPRWGVHEVIIGELKDADVHPMMILIRENTLNDQWPNADIYIPKIIDTLGARLFGRGRLPRWG